MAINPDTYLTQPTANQQIPIATSLPDPNWSDQQLMGWFGQNAGRVVFSPNGGQITIPESVANAGTIRGMIKNPGGTLNSVSLTAPGGGTAAGGGAASAPGAGGAAMAQPGGGVSYGGGGMTWNQVGQALGLSPGDATAFQQQGFTPDQVLQSFQTTGGPPKPATGTPAAGAQNAFGISQVGSGAGYTTLKNTSGQTISVDNAGNYFNIDAQGNHVPVSDTQAVSMGFQSANPETNALKQLGQIDPQTEALRQNLAGSYLPQLNQISGLVKSVTGQAPTSAADALAKYQQLDPQGYANMQALGGAEGSYLKQTTDQLNLGSQLDPVTARQVEQQTRLGQAARGNLYGTPQMVEEAMTTGQAGLALQAQRQQAEQAATGSMQGYLTSGATPGAVGTNLYQQGLSNQTAALGLQQQANQSALGYLGSGQTPYQAGASYLGMANQNAAGAAQGGPVYNPASLGQGLTGTSQAAPQYGLDVGQQSQNWYNSLSAYSGAGSATPQKNQAVSALGGAASGALAGATAGSAIPGVGTAIGAVAGGLIGGAGGYFS
jgi:hypothetical protein